MKNTKKNARKTPVSRKKATATSAATRRVRIAASDVISGDRFVLNGQKDGVVVGAYNSVSTNTKGKVLGMATALVIRRNDGGFMQKMYGMTDKVMVRETPSMRKIRKATRQAMLAASI